MSERPRDSNLWTVRLLSIVLLLSIISCGLMAAGIASLFPVKEIRPFVANFSDRSDVVATIQPVTQSVGGFDALARSLAKEYVIMRHSIVSSSEEMAKRWNGDNGQVFLMSSQAVYTQFLREATKIYTAAQQNGANVSIDVKSANTIEAGKTYQVEFVMETRDRNGRPMSEPKTFIATMDVVFAPIRTSIGNSLINPTGFTVVNYTNTEKGS